MRQEGKNTLVMLFFGRIHTDIPQIDENFRDLCEADIQIEELDKDIDKLSSGKSPGPDGLTHEFYKFEGLDGFIVSSLS